MQPVVDRQLLFSITTRNMHTRRARTLIVVIVDLREWAEGKIHNTNGQNSHFGRKKKGMELIFNCPRG